LSTLDFFVKKCQNNPMDFDYIKICNDLLEIVPERTKEVISRRFGFEGKKPETLDAIGKGYGVCRERVRQIESAGFKKISKKSDNYESLFKSFRTYLKKKGGLVKEETILFDLGGEEFRAQIAFLLTLDTEIKRFKENDDFYATWALDKKYLDLAKKVVDVFYSKLREENRLLKLSDFNLDKEQGALNAKIITSYINACKRVDSNDEGKFGLAGWPEINPRKIKDKAYNVFAKKNKPLHFREAAALIGEGTLAQTVHNELIRDNRFVLVGRGLYALKEWGYETGVVKDVIAKLIKENGPMERDMIIQKVSEQRLVKRNTIVLNLSNKNNFIKTDKGYTVNES
jgi:hypothetical protein